MTHEEQLKEISKYLSNEDQYNRIPDVEQYTHFVKGVYVVQTKGYNTRFSPKFLAWIDTMEFYNVFLARVTENIYTIVVKKES